jgi:hypothetical protein
MTAAGRVELTELESNNIAWEFLRSEFAESVYCDWPIDRRFDVFLHHRGRDDLINDGAAYDNLLQRVMVNIGPALRRGILSS